MTQILEKYHIIQFYNIVLEILKRVKKEHMFAEFVKQVKKLSKINVKKLDNIDKNEYCRNIDILNKHKQVVENQKWAYNHITNNLDNKSCVLILDFKENFKLSNSGNEMSYDYYNKRKISCLGVALIFRDETNKEFIQYVCYLY